MFSIFVLCLSLASLSYIQADSPIDLFIYGATPGGIATALNAAAESSSLTVALVERTKYIGGMAGPGGIGFRDHVDVNLLNSSELEWANLNAKHYNLTEPVWQPDNYVGEANFLVLLSRYPNIKLLTEVKFKDVTMGVTTANEPKISGISTTNADGKVTNWSPKYVVDASYEGDVIAAAGVSVTFGRESSEQYNESFGGVWGESLAQFPDSIDPYWDKESTEILKFIQTGPDPRVVKGQADDHVMAYSFRACLSDDINNKVMFPKPDGYNTSDFELVRRLIDACVENEETIIPPWAKLGYSGFPDGYKIDACCGSSPMGIDAPGQERGYVNGTWEDRDRIYKEIKYYVQGLMYYWQGDPDANIPDAYRQGMLKYGLCKDQWVENGNFPPLMYVREAYRMVGDKVLTQHERFPATATSCNPNSIGLGEWGIDVHDVQRVVVQSTVKGQGPIAFNEGLESGNTGGFFAYELSYDLILPKRKEVVNVFAVNCPSVSHVLFAGYRTEPTIWRFGQAAGTAVGLAVEKNIEALHDVEVVDIQKVLFQQGVAFHYPPRENC